eukprot:g2021.t1
MYFFRTAHAHAFRLSSNTFRTAFLNRIRQPPLTSHRYATQSHVPSVLLETMSRNSLNKASRLFAAGGLGRGVLYNRYFARTPVPISLRETLSRDGSNLISRLLVAGGLSGLVGGTASYFLVPKVVFPDDIVICRIPRPADLVEHPLEKESYLWKLWFKIRRLFFLTILFLPCMTCGVVQFVTGDEFWRKCFLSLMTTTIEVAGCSFQKFAQWMSMRPDMFAADTIEALSKMRDGAPEHDMTHTRKMIKLSFGRELEEIFEYFDENPIASGTVAQVHRARLRPQYVLPGQKVGIRKEKDSLVPAEETKVSLRDVFEGKPSARDVAVKIRHPSVIDETFIDVPLIFEIMSLVPSLTVPFSRDDFTIMLQRQFDFKWEAYNLMQFAVNFRKEIAAGDVFFPEVSPELLSSSVLVESWCEAKSVANIFEVVGEGWARVVETVEEGAEATQATLRRAQTAVAGTFDKLMIDDAAVEAKETVTNAIEGAAEVAGEAKETITKTIETVKSAPTIVSDQLQEKKRQLAKCIFDINIKMMLRDNLVHGDLHAGNLLFNESPGNMTLTIIDAGVTTSLSQEMRAPFMGFLYSMITGDAAGMAKRLVQFSEDVEGEEIDVKSLEKDIKEIASHWVGPGGRSGPNGEPISVGDLMGELLFNLHKHKVRLKGDVASSLVTISISEGLIRQLDPEFDMVKEALPYFILFQEELRKLKDADLIASTEHAKTIK